MGENRAASEYELIDFENAQPKNLELLKKHPFKVFVFCGAHQAMISLALASRMQELGTNARYVEMSGIGHNALDFHIAFYLGELVIADPDAHFHIISRDMGFGPLIRHLRNRYIRVQRENDLAEIPVLRMAGTPSGDERIDSIVRNLKGRGHGK